MELILLAFLPKILIFVFQFGGSVSLSGHYGGFSGSLSVDINTLSESMKKGSKFGCEETTFNVGGENMPEPISIKLVSLSKVFDEKLYKVYMENTNQRASCRFANDLLEKLTENIKKILNNYDKLLGVSVPEGNN